MTKARSDVLYASNVSHYDHVIGALLACVGSVDLVRRFEVTPRTADVLKRLGLPRRFHDELVRRARAKPMGIARSYGFGFSHDSLEALSKLGLPLSLGVRERTEVSARRVGQLVHHPVFQFVEGLGHQALERGRYQYALMERRNLHHAVFEAELTTYAGFPFEASPDPIGDLLEEEYARTDVILVYSEVARRSFLERGFAPEKVVVSPLGAPRSHRGTSELGRQKQNLLYVGRLDAYKGVDVAVEAVRQLGAPYRLRVAGPGSASAIRWLISHSFVDYLGVLDRKQLAKEYATASRLLAPSIESFGLAIVEAYASGLRVIGRETAGVASELPDRSAAIVTGRDPAAWATRIEEDLNIGAASDAGEAALADFSWARAQGVLEAFYRERLPGSLRSRS